MAGEPYRMRVTDEGLLFFILPRTMPAVKENPTKVPLEYDLTLASATDSVAFTATVSMPYLCELDSVTILLTAEKTFHCPLQHIYASHKGKHFLYRVRFHLSMKELREYIDAPLPQVTIGQAATYAFKPKQWKKEQKQLRLCLDIYSLNLPL